VTLPSVGSLTSVSGVDTAETFQTILPKASWRVCTPALTDLWGRGREAQRGAAEAAQGRPRGGRSAGGWAGSMA
jgi:hypothetical protein